MTTPIERLEEITHKVNEIKTTIVGLYGEIAALNRQYEEIYNHAQQPRQFGLRFEGPYVGSEYVSMAVHFPLTNTWTGYVDHFHEGNSNNSIYKKEGFDTAEESLAWANERIKHIMLFRRGW